MREIVETGTDVATVAIGDPSLLASLRACNGRGYENELSRAVSDGALWSADIGSDGAYLFHVFVDEEPTPPVATFLRDPVVVECFRVPSGRLLVAGQELPASAIRYLCDEWDTFSPIALTWILPSYLRHILTEEDERDPRPTEYLVYNLGPSPEHEEDTRLRLSLLTAEQVTVLAATLDYLCSQPYWNDYWGDDLAAARAFLQTAARAARR
jgi:hypothetical protein